MTLRNRTTASALLAVSAVLAAPMLAQNTNGSISGTVRDASGAVIRDASITITNEDTGVARTFKSSGSGVYTATTLNYGSYTVTIEAPGFSKQTVTHLVLHAYDALTVNGDLKTGSSNEEISVTADQLQLNLENATVAGLLNGTQVKELILNNRNYEQLLALQPGVVYGGTSDQLYIGNSLPSGLTATVAFSVSGNRSSTNNWTIDGTTNVDRGSNLTLLSYPSIDAIQEIKTLRNTYTAEYGGSVGGQVNVVIRSGTNKLHGTVYEFFRNDVFNANAYFNKLTTTPVPRPLLRYNDFGGTIGGPIWKDHTFFFFSGEYRRVINYASTTLNGVPTLAERTGDFGATRVCTSVTVSGTTATCAATGTRVTNISPTAAAYISAIYNKVPAPNSSTDAHQLIANQRSVYNQNQEIARIDHNFGHSLLLTGRMVYDEIPTVEAGGAFTNASSLPGTDGNTVNRSNTNSPGHNYLGRATWTVSPTLVVEGGYDYSYGAILSTPSGYLARPNSSNITPTLPFTPTLGISPIVTLTGSVSLTSSGIYNVLSKDHEIFAQATKTLGRHTLVLGGNYHRYMKTENATGTNAGSFAFTDFGNPNAGAGAAFTQNYQQSFANFLTGYVTTFTQASVAITPRLKANIYEAFVQDNFKLTPRLTVNAGVRYSVFGQPVDQNNYLDNFDPANYNASVAPTIDSNGNICTVAPCVGGASPNPNYDRLNGIILGNASNSGGYPTAAAHQSPYGASVSPNKYKNFAPRLGFAWNVFGNGMTALRGGYGYAFDSTLFGTYEQNSFANPPYVQTPTYSNVRFDNPAGGTANNPTTFAPGALRGTDANFRVPYTQQYSFGIQQQLASDLVLNADYVGNHGVHLQGIVDVNQLAVGQFTQAPLNLPVTTGTGSTAANRFTTSGSELVLNRIRPYLGYNAVNVVKTAFGSNYNSLQVQLQKRFKGSSLVDLNYTWSKALTDNQTDRSTAIQDRSNPRGEYGRSQLDRRHVFTADFVYELPFFRDQKGLVGHLAGGWQFSGIVAANSGLPFTATTSNLDPGGLGFLGASAAGGRPDQISDPNSGVPGLKTRLKWFNTAAFAPVPVGTVRPGNARRGTINGPGFQRWDLGFMRNFKITEGTALQFRAESYNTFNHTNWATIAVSAYTSANASTIAPNGNQFGQVTAARDNRILQLALKLNY